MEETKGIRSLEDIIKLATEKGYVHRFENSQNRLKKGAWTFAFGLLGSFMFIGMGSVLLRKFLLSIEINSGIWSC